eukprot:TRINITY_DN1093_c0_g1_i1.p1 TRINITY_DN1093_c0_g1~~TRINITY_DN1093_c0_g1_i1.p1  ORF type:complete len:281 (+),score=40.53 TRINITY_DN1093_c0_g1_i1:44-844(+)
MGSDISTIPAEAHHDPRYQRKTSTVVVGILGLIFSMIGLIVGYIGLGIGIALSLLVLCVFPAFYITSWSLLIVSLSKKVVTRQITTCCLVFGILAFFGHIGDLAWAASYITAYCNNNCVDTYFGFYDCEYWASWCVGGVVGTIGMSIHLVGLLLMIVAAGIEHNRAYSFPRTNTVVTYVQQPNVQYVQQPNVQYVSTPGVQVISTGGNGSVVLTQPGAVQYVQSPVVYTQSTHASVQYVQAAPPVQYVQPSPHSTLPPSYDQALNH